MKKIFYILFLNICFSYGQSFERDSIPAIEIKSFSSNYKDFVVVDRIVYAITKGDSLVSFNLKNDKIIYIENNVVALTETSKDNLILAKTDGSIFKDIGKNQHKIDFIEGKIFKILVDKNDNPIVISNKSIYYRKQHYLPQKKSSMYGMFGGHQKGKKELVPVDVFFLDSNERIWFGYDVGEWGGNICFFDIKNNFFSEAKSLSSHYNDKYDVWPKNKAYLLKEFPNKIKIVGNDTIVAFPHEFDLSNIKGITEDKNGNIYTTTSLMHMMLDGNIIKFIKVEKDYYKAFELQKILEHKIFNETTNVENSFIDIEEYLGLIQYNPFDEFVYYYTNNGFFKIIEKDNAVSKEFIFRPWITWTYGMSHSVGYQMNVIKMEFISKNELVFLTSNNGIGYFDGEKVKYFK
ncbi:hypothetical protein [Flavobacterium soli]|uniref:hypothetical protein n=1 Tax=Flavobacterium soli TaxID=344881 RepID=UPI000424CF3A|nr:hypothetical protein [Flavobacterium soli]